MLSTQATRLKTKTLILEQLNLKSTPLREALIKIFFETPKSLSQKELVDRLKKRFGVVDRISVYRNLVALKKAGFLHQLEDNQYIACQHQCDHHAHVLFFCVQCKSHQEITDHKQIRSISQSLQASSFFSFNGPITIQGLCLECGPSKNS